MEYIYKFDESAVNLILAGLSKLPYETSASLIHQMQAEAQRQRELAAPPKRTRKKDAAS